MSEAFNPLALQPSNQAPLVSKIAIAASFTVFPIVEPLRFWLEEVLGMSASIELSEVGQVMQTLLDPKGIFAVNPSGLNVVLLRWEDWNVKESNDGEEKLKLLTSALSSSVSRSRAPFLVCICPPSPQVLEDPTRSAQFQRMDDYLKNEVAVIRGVFAVKPAELAEMYPLADYHDLVSEEAAWVPYRSSLFVVMAAVIARRLYATITSPYKAIVVDCDETLWEGACGEDGPLGVVIDEPRQTLQKALLAQLNAGMLICLCSKNNADDVLAVFERRSEMALTMKHIAAQRINWESKVDNIRSLANELGIGVDSFLFIDDNPLEIAQVRAALPEVLALQLPPLPSEYPSFLRSVWAFDPRLATAEDKMRTVQYHEERERKQLRTNISSLEEFLAALDLRVRIRPLEEGDLGRSAQLTQRVNQFTLSTVRRSEAELASLWRSQTVEGLVVEVSDRFGNYGHVGLLLFSATDSKCLRIDSFLLSCRVLGRGVEHCIVAELGKLARKRGLKFLELPFVKTSRNLPMQRFLQSVEADYRQEDQAECYLIPAEAATRVRYSPSGPEGSGESSGISQPIFMDPRERGMGGDQGQMRSQLLVRIATDLAAPAQIQAAFETWQRKTRTLLKGDYSPPQNEVECSLASVWAEVLGIERVGMRDSFFELDGDSLKMVLIIARVMDVFGVELPIECFFEQPTVEAQAKKIIELQTLSDGKSAL